MAFVHGKNVHFTIDDSGGIPRDISAYVTSVEMSRSADTAETSTFGDSNKEYLAGLKDATISIEGVWDPTVDGYLEGILGAAEGDFIYGPAGSTGGNIKYTGKCICTAYNPPGSISGAVTYSAQFQCSGAITRTTF